MLLANLIGKKVYLTLQKENKTSSLLGTVLEVDGKFMLFRTYTDIYINLDYVVQAVEKKD